MQALLLHHSHKKLKRLTDGVTGNTSGFGPEESRFEPWSVNDNTKSPDVSGLF